MLWQPTLAPARTYFRARRGGIVSSRRKDVRTKLTTGRHYLSLKQVMRFVDGSRPTKRHSQTLASRMHLAARLLNTDCFSRHDTVQLGVHDHAFLRRRFV